MLGQLFDTMATGGDFGLETIRHFNGNLFDDRTVLELTAEEVKLIAAAAALDWSAVDPSIFGTLFERGLDPAKRSQLGAHFTSREDIELVVDAVVMTALRREWDETRAIIESLLTTGRKSGTGILPVIHGRDAHATEDAHATFLNPYSPLDIRQGAYLPHWTQAGATYAACFRLADSLPADVLRQWVAERDDILKTARTAGRDLSEAERNRRAVLHSEKIERWLDAGHGACRLNDDRVASVVRDAMLHFDGQRYELLAWCVMPNHVHAVLRPLAGLNWRTFCTPGSRTRPRPPTSYSIAPASSGRPSTTTT